MSSTLTVSVSDFAAALGRVVNASDRRGAMPILSHVRVQTSGEKIGLTCADNEIEMTTAFPNGSAAGIASTLPVRKLYDIFKALPSDGEATIAVDEGGAEVRCGRSKFTLNTLPAEDFPSIQDFKPNASITVPAALLADLIGRVEHALAANDVRTYLNGMLLEVETNTLRVVATDGHRLAMAEHTTPTGAGLDKPVKVIIPRRSLIEISKLITKQDGVVEVAVNDSHARVTIPGTRFFTRLVDAKFPDYRRVIPSGHPMQATMSRDALVGALTRAKIMANEVESLPSHPPSPHP